MKIFDTVNVKIIRKENSVVICLPLEYASLENFDAVLSAGVDGDDFVFMVKPDIKPVVKDTINSLWSDMRVLFSKINDIGETPPWDDIDLVWQSPHSYEKKIPISSEEVLEYWRIRSAVEEKGYMEGSEEDVRKGIHDTFTKLCEMASRKLGFKDKFFQAAFGDAVANKYSLISCMYGTYDVVCEIFSEEFVKVNDDRFWSLTSEKAQDAVQAAFERIKYLESDREEFEKERARVQEKWGFPLRA
ncbi:hypothetical protein CUJ83_09160 [Methanocella sp. CWC-04]|uniref:Uncharacterized protein n=1 Tax=Methanooceanicella nereidis TaxID=2052831 RepID=A0AAP2RFH9_9EURY|nr:hypothetical protein [Methanocella sp. CWC-04]MCD1295165.1 hypothetical protein [Methanocella sp. CWC-04]